MARPYVYIVDRLFKHHGVEFTLRVRENIVHEDKYTLELMVGKKLVWTETGFTLREVFDGYMFKDVEKGIAEHLQNVTDELLSEGIFKKAIKNEDLLVAIHHIPSRLSTRNRVLLKETAVLVTHGTKDITFIVGIVCEIILDELEEPFDITK